MTWWWPTAPSDQNDPNHPPSSSISQNHSSIKKSNKQKLLFTGMTDPEEMMKSMEDMLAAMSAKMIDKKPLLSLDLIKKPFESDDEENERDYSDANDNNSSEIGDSGDVEKVEEIRLEDELANIVRSDALINHNGEEELELAAIMGIEEEEIRKIQAENPKLLSELMRLTTCQKDNDESVNRSSQTDDSVTFITTNHKLQDLNSKNTQQTPMLSRTVNREAQIAAAKQLALRYKRAGDMEAAKDAMCIVKSLEEGNPLSTVKQIMQEANESTNALLNYTSKQNNAAPPIVIEKNKTLPGRIVVERLEEQATKCMRAIRLYDSQKKTALTQAMRKRMKAVLDDLEEAKMLLKENDQFGLATREYVMTFDTQTMPIPGIRSDEMQITLSQLDECRGLNNPECERWVFVATLDNYRAVSQGPVALSPKSVVELKFDGMQRDLKLTKMIEHRKLRIELFKLPASSLSSLVKKLWNSSNMTSTGLVLSLRIDGLLKEPVICESSQAFVMPNNKSIGLKADIRVAVQTPIGSKPLQRVRESWITIDTKNHAALPSAHLEQVEQPSSTKSPKTSPLTNNNSIWIPVEEIVSYAVLEEELAALEALPQSSRSHPSVQTRMSALECARDEMALRVETGQLSQDDYKQRVIRAIPVYKSCAVNAKRLGNIQLARCYLQAAKSMQAELVDDEGQ